MIITFVLCFLFFVVLFSAVSHLLMSCHNFSLFIQVPCILFHGDLLTLKTHHYKLNSMNSLNSMKELWKNSTIILAFVLLCSFHVSSTKMKSALADEPVFCDGIHGRAKHFKSLLTIWTMHPAIKAMIKLTNGIQIH